jgi:hypothetical protein
MKSLCTTALLGWLLCGPAGAGTLFEDFAEVTDFRPFHATDPLTARDEWGPLHQTPAVNETDFAKRYHWRPLYWFEGKNDLVRQPAYIGAVQRDLTRLGYYCGAIDGIYSDELSDAIARLQKNHAMRVTGTLTIAVRRALHLP